jgi:uncharacterized lipoprotein
MVRLALISVCVVAAVAGCSHEDELKCDDPTRYATSTSVPPIRVPDDLTVPDESDSLLIPDPTPAESSAPTECLETPPSYYEQNDETR